MAKVSRLGLQKLTSYIAVIRYAQPSDVHNIQMVVRHNSKCFGFVMECFIAESIKRRECIVVEEGEQIIGFVRFGYLKKKKMTRIHEICIEKDFRGGILQQCC